MSITLPNQLSATPTPHHHHPTTTIFPSLFYWLLNWTDNPSHLSYYLSIGPEPPVPHFLPSLNAMVNLNAMLSPLPGPHG